MKKRLLAMMMAFVMAMSLLPMSVFAVNENNDVTINKTAKRIDADTWDITMTVNPKGSIKPEPIELVLLMDVSLSMNDKISKTDSTHRMEAAHDAAEQLVNELAAVNVNAKVSVVTFAIQGTIELGMTDLDLTNKGTILNAIPTKESARYAAGTYMNHGLKAAADAFTPNTSAKKVIVMLSDGKPQSSWGDTTNPSPSAEQIKGLKEAGITVHTVAFTMGIDVLESISTGTGGQYFIANNMEELTRAFTEIKKLISAMVYDPLGEKVSIVGSASAREYNAPTVNNGVMQWSPEKRELTSNDQVTITYKVRVDPKKLAVGENENVPLNGQATLNYVVQQNGTASENRHLNFPIPTDDIEVGQLTTKVMLDGKELTAEQVVGDKIIVYENNQFTWKLPAADATKIINGVTYTYSHSEYDSKETAATSAPVTVGAHTLVHYYNSTPKYGVTYEIGFAKNTPTENRPTMTVTDDAKYAVGETVPVQSVPQSVEDTQNNGVWTFDGWYLDDRKVDDRKAPDSVLMKKDGLRFTGTWNFEKNQPAVTVKKELAGKWNGTSFDPADTYSPDDRVVYKITATVNADNVKSFTIADVVGENLKDGTFIVEKGALDSGKVWLNGGLKDLKFGKYYSKIAAESATDTRETYDFSTNSVTLTRQKAERVPVLGNVFKTDTTFNAKDEIIVYYFATVENVDKANQTFYNTANVTANGDTHTSTTDPTPITLKPYHVTFQDKDGNVIEGYDKTKYPYGETIGDKVPADPEVADGTDGKLLQRFDGWYETTTNEALNTETAYNHDVVFRAKVTDVMKVEKALTTDSSGLKVGDEVSYTITATVYDASLTSITVTENPGPGLIGGTLTCDNAVLRIVSLGGVRTATVAIDGNTATVTPNTIEILGQTVGGFESGDTVTFTYTATLGIADTILTDNGTRNTVTLTNNNEGETATDTTCPVENVGLPTIDVNVAKTVKEINGEPYNGETKVSKGDTVTYEITVTNDGSVPVFGVPVIEKPSENLINGRFVPEEGTVTIKDLTKIDLSDISALIRNLMSGKSTLNVALGSNANLVLTADWSKVNPKELLEALTTIRNIKDLDSLLSALDTLLTKPDVTAGSIEEAIGNIENYMAALLQKYGFLNGTLYVDGKCADVAILGRIDKNASATLTYTATVNDCDENGKVINTVCVGCDEDTAEIDAQRYTVTYTDGVDNEVVFEDQVYTVISGAETPHFDAPTRDGYAFTGWKPEVADTVTGDATYTATWTNEIIPVLFYISGLDTKGYIVENPVPSIPNLSVKDGYVYLNAMFTATQGNAETLEIKGNEKVAQWLNENIYDFFSTYTVDALIDAANVHDANLDADDFAGWVYQSVHWEGNEGWHVHIALTKPTTPIEPEAAAYKVEHYKWNPETVTYDLVAEDTEMKSAKLNTEVTAVAKTYEGYALNPQAAGFKQSGIVTMPKAGDDGIIDMLVLKLYYDIDTKGDSTDPENKGDDIPDKYQKKVTFKVVNGAWNDETTADVIKYVTLTNGEGKWAVDGGTYTVTAADVTAIPAVGEKPNSGYKAGSWDALYEEGYRITADVTFTYTYAKKSSNNNGGGSKPSLNKEDHYAYIVGYPDGTVQPGGNITRAEVATIFFRMLTDDSRNEFWSQTNDYSDVSEGQWFNNAISTLANAGILSGYPDGTFRPNAPITRAEFTKIAASFFERVEYTIDNPFNDVDDDDWFYKFVMAAYEGGLITGYPEGDFRPNANISRAESVTIVNRTLERAPDADHFLKDMIVWPDNGEDAWYYEAVQEATNSHEYVMKGSGDNKYENWTKILEVRDWPALEKEWSDANSAAGGEVVK